MSDGVGSDRTLRGKVRLDYGLLHSVGERELRRKTVEIVFRVQLVTPQ